MADDDPVATLLKKSPLTQSQRADLWDAYHASSDADGLVSAIQALNVPKTVKAQLWDLKQSETPAVPKTPPNLNAQGGDTINGQDPNARPGIAQRFVRSSLESMANPQSGLDLIGVGGLSSAPIAESLGPKVVGPIMESLGRGASAVANAFKPATKYLGIGDVLYHRGGLAEGAAVTAAPYVLDAAGQGAQKVGQFLQRTEPLLKFEAPAVSVERPTTAVVQAAKEAAPAATEVAPRTVKPILNALEMKEYLRLTRAGKTHAEAMELIDFGRKLSPVTDKQMAIENDYIRAHGRRQQ